jgi:hypothetical protein
VDQCYLGRDKAAAARMVWNWNEDDAAGGSGAGTGAGIDSGTGAAISRIQSVCHEAFIRAEVEKAEEYGLEFGSVGIDDRSP